MAPIAAAMFVLGPQIAIVLFDHGHSASSTVHDLLGVVVAAFGVALVPFTGYMILQRGFYALQDTRTPALVTGGVSVVGAGRLRRGRRPRATARTSSSGSRRPTPPRTPSVSSPLLSLLRRRLGRIDGRRLVRTHLRVIAATALGAGGAVLAMRATALFTTPDVFGAIITIVVAGAFGAACYLAVATVLHVGELRLLMATVTGRGAR